MSQSDVWNVILHYGVEDYVFVEYDDAGAKYALNTNDLLYWGCADAELLSDETLPAFKQALEDCLAVGGTVWDGCVLYACRQAGMRPQGACYPENRAVWPLLDAAGPEREVGIGNPCKPGDYR